MMDKDLAQETIRLYSKQLKTPTFIQYRDIIAKLKADEGYEEFLIQLIKKELDARDEKGKNRRIKAAKFPYIKTFDELELERFENTEEAFLKELATCQFIKDKQNLVMIGNPGTGKTHLSIALGIKACQMGYNVKFLTVSNLIYSLMEEKEDKKLLHYEKQLNKADLLILDELSYLTLDRIQADLLFKVISDRSERKSTIITTNLTFSEWSNIFGDDRLVNAMVGRLTYNSYVINANSEHPYREDHAVIQTNQK